MRFSVIIPTLNEAEVINERIVQVRSLNPEVEIIVADGGSTDSTVKIAELRGVKVCRSRRGKGWQCNAGAALASGDVLAFLHADAALPPGAFAQLEDIFRDDKVQIGTFRLSFDVEHWLLRFFHLLSRLDPGLMRFGDQCIVVRKSFFNSLGGFPELSLFEDIGLMRKARKVARIHRFPMVVTASSRRFLQNGFIKQQVRNVFYTLLYFLGMPPEKIAVKYECSNSRLGSAAIIIFARFPRPGEVKTRMSDSLSGEVAANFYRLCAERVFDESSKLPDNIRKHVVYAGEKDGDEIRRWAGAQFRFSPQVGGGLGKRIERAFSAVFKEGARKVIILASDVPDLSAEIIDDAIRMLERHDIVIGPCLDGGYYLLGMKKLYKKLFRRISWSTEQVYQQTISCAEKMELTVYNLPSLADIDTEEDLRKWSAMVTCASHPVLQYARALGFKAGQD